MLAIRQTASASDSGEAVVIDNQDENESNKSYNIVDSRPMIIVEESNDTDLSPAGSNPWPYISEYFKFLGCRREASLEFLCLICKPVINKLSINRRSHFNFKKNMCKVCIHNQKKLS